MLQTLQLSHRILTIKATAKLTARHNYSPAYGLQLASALTGSDLNAKEAASFYRLYVNESRAERHATRYNSASLV